MVYRFLEYLVAFIAGLVTSWWVFEMTAGRYFAPDLSASAERIVILGLLAPLAGLAVVQLVLSIRQRRGWTFWLIGVPLTYGTLGLVSAGIYTGMVTVIEGLVIGLFTLFVLGWLLLTKGAKALQPPR